MKTFVTIAAFAVIAMLGTANAASTTLSANEAEICRTLELAHETSCAEYRAGLIADALEETGSIEPAGGVTSYMPYTNGMGDPAGVTLSNR
jgi:hypothetical protein